MLNHCTSCTTAYAVGLDACPHCATPAGAAVTVPAEPPEPARRRARRDSPPDTEAGTDD